MSHMDGITLAKNVLESYPGVKIIFISGYADVGYLRDALKMEAVDYILKSIDIDELDAVITKVVAMLDQRSSQQLVLEDMARKLEQSMPLLRQRRLCDLLQNNDESEEDILQSIEFLGIPLNSQTHYAVLVLRLQPKSKWLTMAACLKKTASPSVWRWKNCLPAYWRNTASMSCSKGGFPNTSPFWT